MDHVVEHDNDDVSMTSGWHKIDWNSVFEKKINAPYLFLRKGLVRKNLLVLFAKDFVPESHLVDLRSCLQILRSKKVEYNTNSGFVYYWVLKPCDSSNANGIIFLRGSDKDEMRRVAHSFENRKTMLLQRMVCSKLIKNRKFHIRLLVLVVGKLRVFTRKSCKVFLSSEPAGSTSLFAHITNRGFNLKHAEYSEVLQNLDFHDALKDSSAHVYDTMCKHVHTLFSRLENEPKYFFPLENCYEMFGFDFMVDVDDRVFLLEANPNPSIHSLHGVTKDILLGPDPITHVDMHYWKLVYESGKTLSVE